MSHEIHFSDYINILTSNYDSIIFNPVYSKVLGVHLYCEGESPIKCIMLDDSIVNVFYLDGSVKTLEGKVLSIDVDDNRFKRRMKMGINGNLLKYSSDDAKYYKLDMSKAFPKEVLSGKKRKRSM